MMIVMGMVIALYYIKGIGNQNSNGIWAKYFFSTSNASIVWLLPNYLNCYCLISSRGIMLNHPSPKMLSTLGGRAFTTAAPKMWNYLPIFLLTLQSLNTF